MLWYLDFGRKDPHAQQTFVISHFLRNQDVISQGQFGFLRKFSFFFHKIVWFFENVGNNIFTFFRVAKQGIICFTDISSSSKTLKIWSKIPYAKFMESCSNSNWWFLSFRQKLSCFFYYNAPFQNQF